MYLWNLVTECIEFKFLLVALTSHKFYPSFLFGFPLSNQLHTFSAPITMYILCWGDHVGTSLNMLLLLPETISHIFTWLILTHSLRLSSTAPITETLSHIPGQSFILSYHYTLIKHCIFMY